MEKSEIQAVISEKLAGLKYKAEFVPKSKSRNKDEKNPTLNWLITMSSGNSVMTFDYQQGIAHLPDYNQSESSLAYYGNYVRECTETGKYIKNFTVKNVYASSMFQKQTIIPCPEFIDILYCCVLDSNVLDAGGFDTWASDYGYDVDSRAAEKIYNECLQQSLKLVSMIGYGTLEILRETFQDY